MRRAAEDDVVDLTRSDGVGASPPGALRAARRAAKAARLEAARTTIVVDLRDDDGGAGPSAGAGAGGAGSVTQPFTCGICFCDSAPSEGHLLFCGDVFCRECLRQHIASQVADGLPDAAGVRCPAPACRAPLTGTDVVACADAATAARFDQLALDKLVQTHADEMGCCPTPGCPFLFAWDPANRKLSCPMCKNVYCVHCKCDWHTGLRCEHRAGSTDEEAFTKAARAAHYKKCPRCAVWTEKIAGCDGMTCRCGAHFCFRCGSALKKSHGLAAAVEPPLPQCELSVAFGAASAPGEWPLAHAALWLFNNRRDVNFSAWQAVWTLAETDALIGDTVTGALLINPGGPGGQPCRAINTEENAPLVAGRGGRWFGYEFESAAAPPVLHAPTRLSINGLSCTRSSNLTLDASGDAVLSCDAMQLTGCGFAWFCCGDVLAPPEAPPLPQLLALNTSTAPSRRQANPTSGARKRTLAAAVASALAGTSVTAAAFAIRRRRSRRRAALQAQRAAAADAFSMPALAEEDGPGDGAVAAPQQAGPPRRVTFATRSSSNNDSGGLSPWASSTNGLADAATRGGLPRLASLTHGGSGVAGARPAPPPAALPHPLHASLGAARRISGAVAAASGAAAASGSGAGLSRAAAAVTEWAAARAGAALGWRDLWGFNTWTTLNSASSAHSSLRTVSVSSAAALPASSCTGANVPMVRRTSSAASMSSVCAATPATGVADIDFAAEVELDALLGTGAFGAVYRGRWRRAGGRAVAVKMLHHVGGADELVAFQSEVAVLSRLSHPRVVQFLGACLAPPHACMLEELVEGGSLHSFLHGPGGRRFTLLELLSLSEDIASAMAYLHPTVVHRDLKSQNVLLDPCWRAKVCDFGIAKFKSNTFLTTKHVQAGTPAYMAPELFSGGAVNEKIDVWSFGTLLWEMYTGEVPWKGLHTPVQVIFAVAVQHARLPLPAACPPELRELMSACWQREPDARPAFTELLASLRAMRARVGGPSRASADDAAHRTWS